MGIALIVSRLEQVPSRMMMTDCCRKDLSLIYILAVR